MVNKRFKYFFLTKRNKLRYYAINLHKEIIVIFFHGFMSDITGKKPAFLAKFCRNKRVGFLTFEYSGHGKSSGTFTKGNISKWTNDSRLLIKKKIKKKKNLVFIGSSMGSWIALNLFKQFKKQIKGFIGISSAPEFIEKLMWKKFNKKIRKIIIRNKIYHLEHGGFTYPLTKQLIFDGRKNKIFQKNINLAIPLVLFHSLNDKVVPISFSKKILKLCKKSKKKLIKIKKGDHSLSRKSDLKKISNELTCMIPDLL